MIFRFIIQLLFFIFVKVPTEKLSEVESLYTRVRIGDLTTKHAVFFDWRDYLNNFLKSYGSGEVLTDNDEIILMGLEYFTNLNKLIQDYKDNGKENTIKLSVIFHLIKFSLPLLSKEYRTQLVELGEALTGSITVERWQTCIEHTDNIFGLGYAITRMFIRASPNNAKLEAQKMIRSIKNSFIENFPQIKWMDDETRRLAQDKVEKVDELIGYPDFIENDTLLNLRLAVPVCTLFSTTIK
jgi:membrane metallo-endopeptidase-like protein 1